MMGSIGPNLEVLLLEQTFSALLAAISVELRNTVNPTPMKNPPATVVRVSAVALTIWDLAQASLNTNSLVRQRARADSTTTTSVLHLHQALDPSGVSLEALETTQVATKTIQAPVETLTDSPEAIQAPAKNLMNPTPSKDIKAAGHNHKTRKNC